MLDRTRDAALPHAVSDVVGDLADLFQKETRLARAELSAKLTTKIRAGVWMSIAGIAGLIAAVFMLQAATFAITSYGIALHWSALFVGGAVAAIAAIAFFIGLTNAREELAPTRTINQVKHDISAIKEQLT